jgi:hypothetical protein
MAVAFAKPLLTSASPLPTNGVRTRLRSPPARRVWLWSPCSHVDGIMCKFLAEPVHGAR